MKNINFKKRIEKILEEYRDRVTSMGEFFDNKPTIQATEQILQVVGKDTNENH